MNSWSFKHLLWQIVLVVAILFSCIEAPVIYVFHLPTQHWQLWVDGILAIIFTIDLFHYYKEIKFDPHHNQYYKRTGKFLVSQKINLVIFFICCIPFDLFSNFIALAGTIQIFRMVRLFRMVRMVKIFSLVGHLTVIPNWVKIAVAIIGATVAINLITCGWIAIYHLPEDKTPIDYYIHCLYWAITTLTTVGYGDITPPTNSGKLYAMFVMVLGVGVYGVVIGKISQMISDANRHSEKSKEKLQDLTIFMKHYDVPGNLHRESMLFYSNMLAKKLSDNDHQIIADLPQSIQNELLLYVSIKLISGLIVFKNCSKACLKEIAKNLETKSFAPGAKIIEAGEIGHEMYIINHGTVDVLAPDGKHLASLSEGKFFGEKALLEEAPRNATIIASSYCDLYKLEKDVFLRIVKEHPELLTNMENVTKIKMHS